MFRSVLDPLLTWPDLEALQAWKVEHPEDIRGQVVEYISQEPRA